MVVLLLFLIHEYMFPCPRLDQNGLEKERNTLKLCSLLQAKFLLLLSSLMKLIGIYSFIHSFPLFINKSLLLTIMNNSILGKRDRSGEHEAMRKIKNEFMAMWDGLRSREGERVLVLAASNRPFDLDDAVLLSFLFFFFFI